MNVDTRYGPSYTLALLQLSSGETIQAESGAMVSMSDGIAMQTSTKGGVLKAMKRAVLGGESLFLEHVHRGARRRDHDGTRVPRRREADPPPEPDDLRAVGLVHGVHRR